MIAEHERRDVDQQRHDHPEAAQSSAQDSRERAGQQDAPVVYAR